MEQIKIEYLPIGELKPYEKNARKHGDKDVEQIRKSIEKYGMNDPIGIWGDENIIVEGHGRLMACRKLGMTEVPVIRLDHLTDEQRREYAIAHNATAELSGWDSDLLAGELEDLDLSQFDFGFAADSKEGCGENPYTKKTDIPQYVPTMDSPPDIYSLVDRQKTEMLLAEIECSTLPECEKEFLALAATRHYVFNYKAIAEYYAHASEQMQRLMERSALVIIDYDDAIKNGYVRLSSDLMELVDDDEE